MAIVWQRSPRHAMIVQCITQLTRADAHRQSAELCNHSNFVDFQCKLGTRLIEHMTTVSILPLCRRCQGTTEHRQGSGRLHPDTTPDHGPAAVDRRPALQQVVSPFSIPQNDSDQGPELKSAESPFSIRQPLHWQMSRSSSSSRCMSREEASLPMHSFSSHASAANLLLHSSSDSLQDSQPADTWSGIARPSLSCNLPDTCGADEHDANAAERLPLPAVAAAAPPRNQSPLMRPQSSAAGPFSAETIPDSRLLPHGQLQFDATSDNLCTVADADTNRHNTVQQTGPSTTRRQRLLGPNMQKRVPGLKRHASHSLSSQMSDMQLASDND